MRILAVNAGSSSLKLSTLSVEGTAPPATLERWEGSDPESSDRPQSMEDFLGRAGQIDAVGHRIVHGGPRYTQAARIDNELISYLESIRDLAPLHNPSALEEVRFFAELMPGLPAVACFDTAFHSTLPAAAHTYALPRSWNERWGLRRYGFHGLSHAYAARKGAEIAGRSPDVRIVTCHLGAGASLAAVRGGVCHDTTMGFTPLAGLVMGTRSGDVDPGLLVWLLRHGGMAVGELEQALESGSGLKGLSGTSGDLREVLSGRAAENQDCALAFDVFIHRLCREIAAMTEAVGGLDVLVVTGGIGEHAPLVRSSVAERLEYLGVGIDQEANEQAKGDANISSAAASVGFVVVTAREDLEIARQIRSVLAVGGLDSMP